MLVYECMWPLEGILRSTAELIKNRSINNVTFDIFTCLWTRGEMKSILKTKWSVTSIQTLHDSNVDKLKSTATRILTIKGQFNSFELAGDHYSQKLGNPISEPDHIFQTFLHQWVPIKWCPLLRPWWRNVQERNSDVVVAVSLQFQTIHHLCFG